MRIFLFIIINIFSLTNTKNYPLECTESVKDLFDSVMNVAISMEKNWFLPDKNSLKSTLVSIEEIMEVCVHKKTIIPEYYGCFDRMYLVLPVLQDLSLSVIKEEWSTVAKDSITFIVQIVNGITYCLDVKHI